MEDQKIPVEALQDGSILVHLLQRFAEERKRVLQSQKGMDGHGAERPIEDEAVKNAMAGVLACLRDSTVWLPVEARYHDPITGEERWGKIEQVSDGKEQVNIRAVVLRTKEGASFLPVFSQNSRQQQIPVEYVQRYSIVPVSFMKCIQMAEKETGVDGICVDPFTVFFGLNKGLLDRVKAMPSRLK